MVRKIDPGHDSHSRLLSASEMIYEMQSKQLLFIFYQELMWWSELYYLRTVYMNFVKKKIQTNISPGERLNSKWRVINKQFCNGIVAATSFVFLCTDLG